MLETYFPREKPAPKPVHYAVKLRQEIAEKQAKIDAALGMLMHLTTYLQLPKFHTDTKVQVNDVHHRADLVRDILLK
jgi:hypothetical protein